MKTIKNLTPHTLTILNQDFTVKQEIKSEGGNPLRVSTNSETIGEINGISVKRTTYGKCAELPEFQENVYLVVSRMVIDAHPDRSDLLCPNEIVRKDAEGNYSSHPFAKGDIVGCLSLSR